MCDPIVEEVRNHRMEHTLKFNGDLTAICEDGYPVFVMYGAQNRIVLAYHINVDAL